MSISTKRNHWGVFGLIFVLAAGLLVPCFASDQDKVVAIVNKDIITRKDLTDFLNFMAVQMSGKISQSEVQEKLESAKADILNRLIEDKLILQEAKAEKVYVDENRVKGRIEQMKAQFSSTRDYEESLVRQGLTPADVETKIREQMLIYSVIETKVKEKITVKPAEVTDYYQEHASQISEPESRKVSALLMQGPERAREVLDFIKKGGSFEEAAGKFTVDLQDLGFLSKEQSRKEIGEIIFNLKAGEVSSVVKLDSDKYYILKVEEIAPPKQISLDEARDRIAAMLFEQKMQEALVKWIDGLKEKYYVEIKED
ncbi:MAG: peptidyl-prolyl cis-trans isomerase [Candidatus Omnitrophota bacterium]|nr:SurA N-terminal domain-containing protein [Candidatus Omnitrophota bacterium]MDD5654125.1 SurA N-terminal domain-containing protein [Candidatus Omnitrophota bacterium]